jgi:predicted RNase H-like nuclease (RuvC/YqgF family)
METEGGKEAVRVNEDVVAASEVRRLEERIRELERLLGRKTMEVEILKEALDLARVKKRPCCRGRSFRRIPREEDRRDPRGRPFQFD